MATNGKCNFFEKHRKREKERNVTTTNILKKTLTGMEQRNRKEEEKEKLQIELNKGKELKNAIHLEWNGWISFQPETKSESKGDEKINFGSIQIKNKVCNFIIDLVLLLNISFMIKKLDGVQGKKHLLL